MEIVDFLKILWRKNRKLLFSLCLLIIPLLIMLVAVFIQGFYFLYFNTIIINNEDFVKWIFGPCMFLLSIGFALFIFFNDRPRQRIGDPKSIRYDDKKIHINEGKIPVVSDESSRYNVTPIPISGEAHIDFVAQGVLSQRQSSLNQPQDSVAAVKLAFTNLNMTPIIASEDTIYRSISEKFSSIRDQDKWRVYLPITISLMATLIVVKFDDSWNKFGFTGSQWLAVFILILVAIMGYMITLFISSYMHKVTIDDIITDLKKKSL
jgi:predicted site-specific integrase-resolvase